MPRRILHVDMDAFYASVEVRDHPEIAGKPVIVGADPLGGQGRGVVAACSYQARALGVHSAMPISQAWRRCPGGVYLRPRFARYQEVSRQIMEIFRATTDLVEPLSIDEAFLDVTGSITLLGPAETIGRRTKERIREETGLTASVGVAPNKFLAKMASELEKPDGLVVVPEGGAGRFLEPLPIARLWGVGPRTEARLRGFGVRTIGDLAAIPKARLAETLGPSGEHLWDLAHGIDERPVVSHWDPRSISNETTFAEDTRQVDRLVSTLRRLSDHVAARLRAKHLKARTVTMKLRYASFATFTRRSTLEAPTDDAEEIFRLVRAMFARFDLDEAVRLLGVGTANLSSASDRPAQLGLFAGPQPSGDRLSLAVDRIHERFGDGSLRRASDLAGDR